VIVRRIGRDFPSLPFFDAQKRDAIRLQDRRAHARVRLSTRASGETASPRKTRGEHAGGNRSFASISARLISTARAGRDGETGESIQTFHRRIATDGDGARLKAADEKRRRLPKPPARNPLDPVRTRYREVRQSQKRFRNGRMIHEENGRLTTL